MKVVYVVDSINEITRKIDMLKSRFGDNIVYVVKGSLESLFRTYGYQPNAVYSKNLPKVLTMLLLPSKLDDVIICYSSLNLTDNLLNKFIIKIGNRTKIVNVMPKYNTFERMGNSAYNLYVKSLFKINDSMSSPKLQYLPAEFLVELLTSHISNRLFEVNPEYVQTMYIEDKESSEQFKVKPKFNKFQLLPIIAALIISAALIITLTFAKINFVIILGFIVLYTLNILLAIIQQCKLYFDQRFFK